VQNVAVISANNLLDVDLEIHFSSYRFAQLQFVGVSLSGKRVV